MLTSSFSYLKGFDLMNFDTGFDLIVIGGGSAGVRLARRSASYGAKVAVIESAKLGGTCVHMGCVPKKLFYYTAGFARAFSDAEDYGWDFPVQPSLKWDALIQAKNATLAKLGDLYEKTLMEAKVTIIKGKASFIDDHHIEVVDHRGDESTQRLQAKNFAIAVGSRAFLPDVPGIDYARTSNDVFALPKLPKAVLIVGSGYIAVEFACIFAALGVKIKLAYRSKSVLKNFDEDLSAFLTQQMQSKGIELYPETEIKAIRQTGQKYQLDCTNKQSLQTDFVLYATGRVANTEALGLENLSKPLLGKRGSIKVNNFQTELKHIYALGDIIGEAQLTPVAIAQANYLAAHLFSPAIAGQLPDYRWLPTAVFSSPSLATIGLTETDCIAQGIAAEVYVKTFTPLQHSLTRHRAKEMIKLIVAKEDQSILGLHMIGTEGPDIIQAIAPGLRKGLTLEDLESTLALHPSSAEELLNFYPQHLVRTLG